MATAVALFASVGLGALPASAAPAAGGDTPAVPAPAKSAKATIVGVQKFAGGLKASDKGKHAVYVQFTGTGAADAAVAVAPQGKATSKATAKARKEAVRRTASSVLITARSHDTSAKPLYTTSNSVPGVAITADTDALAAIAARTDVVKITPLVSKKIDNSSAAQLTNVLASWQSLGVTGTGVKVGIIDTGIDYTHADFGGPGTVAAYDAAHAVQAGPFTPTAKVVGGYDFAGDDYNADPASPSYQPVPHPDPNPLDCNGHGSHVSGTVAGYGENADGSTFTGSYKNLTGAALDAMKIGPGMAPGALLYGLRVFGCNGSTNLVGAAVDWALDPNGDGDFSDHLDIINLSLGSDYGTVDDPDSAIIDSAAKNGVLPVIAMGNGGDFTDIGGSPGNAVRSLAVASSVDAGETYDGIRVDAPAAIAGIKTVQFSVAYDWAGSAPVSGPVVSIPGANADGCAPFSAAEKAKVTGKVVWLEWDDNDATRLCGSVVRSRNAVAAGAIGAIFTSTLANFPAGITGSAVIPVVQMTGDATAQARPFVDTSLVVTFDGTLATSIKKNLPQNVDLLSGFSSRGTHGTIGVVKPDVSAPGATIASAGVGTGNGVLVESGTSMATPHTAGIAALVKVLHKSWSVEQIKAAIMNTAGHDLWTDHNQTGLRYGPGRVGAGRVDALAAVTTSVLAYSISNPGAVSASFGVVPVTTNTLTVKKTKWIKVQNTGPRAVELLASYEGIVNQPGVTYTVSPRVLQIPARGSISMRVTMTVQPKKLRHTIDPTMQSQETNPVTGLDVARQYVSDASGRVLLSQVGKPTLRLPVYGAAKPISTTTSKAGKVAGDPSIILKGQGVAQGAGSTAFTSLVSVMQLGATSGKLAPCTGTQTTGCLLKGSDKGGDLASVGAGSSPGAGGYADGVLWFGIANYGNWATLTTISPYVDFDVNGDGQNDYEVFLNHYADSDLYDALTVDLVSGDLVSAVPVNFNNGDVDTNIFDNSVLLLGVDPAAIGVTNSDETFPITYSVGTFSGYTGEDIDHSSTVTFDVADPGVGTEAPLYQDTGNVGIPYTLGSKTAAKGAKALVLHLHAALGHRVEVVSLPGTKAASSGSVTRPVTKPAVKSTS